MRFEKGHKERTRKQLLAEAASALRANGPEGVSLVSLMGRLGMTPGGFYAHFPSKEDLVAQAIDKMFEESWASFKRVTRGLPPSEALYRYVEFYLSSEHMDQVSRGCPVPAIAADVSRLPPGAQDRFGNGMTRLLQGVAAIRHCMGYNDVDSMDFAISVLCEMTGAIATARAINSPIQSKHILDVCCCGILSRIRNE